MMRTLAVVGAAVVALSVAGAPTAAAEEGWTMPDLSGMTLADAQAAYDAAIKDTGGPWLEVINNNNGWTIRTPRLYEVCDQAPSAGEALEAQTWTAIAVNKLGDC